MIKITYQGTGPQDLQVTSICGSEASQANPGKASHLQYASASRSLRPRPKAPPLRSLRPRPARSFQALQSDVELIALARLQNRSPLSLRPGPDDGGEDSKEVRVNTSAGAELVSGRSAETLRRCIGGWFHNPMPGVRQEWERGGFVP